jgi:signal transduction histidine kinase
MRTMVRYDQPAALAPAPRLAELAQLAGRPRVGPAVEVELVGDIEGVPAPVGTAVYHMAQESVTNARRHARRASRILVQVVVDDEAVRLRVSDDGEPVNAQHSASGFGLIGMAERARLLGGTWRAGPDPDRGWTVLAELPVAAGP